MPVTYDEGSEDVGLVGVGVRPARSCGHGVEDGVTAERAEVAGGVQGCGGLRWRAWLLAQHVVATLVTTTLGGGRCGQSVSDSSVIMPRR